MAKRKTKKEQVIALKPKAEKITDEQLKDVEELINNIKHHPHDRRLLIDAWKPTNISKSSLPCGHFLYQVYVEDVHLDLCWYQRSGDWMIGVPSDMVFAATLLACIASICNKQPRWINMTIGDAHIYKEHFDQARKQIKREHYSPPKYTLATQEEFTDFQPVDLKIIKYIKIILIFTYI